jgi:hypothetical protein
MVHLQVSEHRLVNIRRSSLCDNCSIRKCTNFDDSRVTECREFRPPFMVIMKCRKCGAIYDPYRNIRSPDYELCLECNDMKGEEVSFSLVCRV